MRYSTAAVLHSLLSPGWQLMQPRKAMSVLESESATRYCGSGHFVQDSGRDGVARIPKDTRRRGCDGQAVAFRGPP